MSDYICLITTTHSSDGLPAAFSSARVSICEHIGLAPSLDYLASLYSILPKMHPDTFFSLKLNHRFKQQSLSTMILHSVRGVSCHRVVKTKTIPLFVCRKIISYTPYRLSAVYALLDM